MGNVLCIEPRPSGNSSSDILFYEVAPPKVSTSQADPLSPSNHQMEGLISPDDIRGKGDHRDLLSISTANTADTRPAFTASSTSSSTIGTVNSSVNTMEKGSSFTTRNPTTSSPHPHIEGKHEDEEFKGEVSSEEATNVVTNTIIEEINHTEDDDEDLLDLLGVSVDHFQNVLYPQILLAGHGHNSKMYSVENLNNAAHGASSVIRDKGKNAFCPLDGQRGSSYVHALLHDTESNVSQKYMSDSGKPDVVGKASIMISYSWDYAIGDILDTVTAYCEMNGLDKKQTYIWIDCLCVNLHRVADLKVKEAGAQDEDNYAQEEKKSNAADFSKRGKERDSLSIFESSDELQSSVNRRIQNIGHVLAIMSPFNQPTYLSR